MNIEQAKNFMNKVCKDWGVEDQVAPWFRELAARELVGLVAAQQGVQWTVDDAPRCIRCGNTADVHPSGACHVFVARH
jgi:ferredoxin